VGAAAGLPPQYLRHSCAAWLVQAGVSIREMAELLRRARRPQMSGLPWMLWRAMIHVQVSRCLQEESRKTHELYEIIGGRYWD